MKAILNLLRKPRATAADLRRALAELPPDTGTGALTALEGRRRAMLLNGSSDTAVEIHNEQYFRTTSAHRLRASRVELVNYRIVKGTIW